jgi:GNAT superfamily N-acetyltransferase
MSLKPEPDLDLAGVRIRALDKADLDRLQDLLVRCSDFIELGTGGPPHPEDAADLLSATPPDRSRKDKLVLGLWLTDDAAGDSAATGDELAGVLDIVRGYPEESAWFLGLLLLTPELRGRGLGERIYRRVEEWVREQGAATIHLGVLERNPDARRFWERLGYEYRDTRTQHGSENRVDYLVKDLARE